MNHTERLNLTMRRMLEVRQVVDMANAVAIYLSQSLMPDALKDNEVLDDLSEPDSKYHPSVQPMADLATPIMDDLDYDGVLEELNLPENAHLLGIYLQVAVPVMKDSSFSWGHLRLCWVFGNTYEEAFKVACEWAKEQGYDFE